MIHEELPIDPRLFANCDVEGETFIGIEILSADLQGAKIIDCIFENCMWSSVDLKDAVLQAKFVGCQIQGINFFTSKRSLLSLSFDGCYIRHSSFAELKLHGIFIKDCTLENVDLADASLISANFRGTSFSDCTFKNTDLSKADFRESRGYTIDPRLNKVTKARFDLPEAVSLLAPFDIRLD